MDRLENLDSKRIVFIIFSFICISIGVFVLSKYLRAVPGEGVRVVLACLSVAGTMVLYANPRLKNREIAVFVSLSALFDLSLILGYHIVLREGDAYSGLASENYISKYSASDAVAFVFMLIVLSLLFLAVYSIVKYGIPCKRRASSVLSEWRIQGPGRILPKAFLLFALMLFASWIPYLIVYYPGFIFGDTTSSLDQIMGLAPFSNHHPIAYTLFIGACLQIAHTLGFGNAAGCALYCLIQMALMAVCFSYATNWITSRFRIKGKMRIAIFALCFVFFGISPYIATYSIAMWKDPLFSVALLMITLLLADIFIYGANAGFSFTGRHIAGYLFFALIVVFFRNNGVYIIASTSIVLAIWLIWKRDIWRGARHKPAACSYVRKLVLVSILVAAAYFVVSGPVLRAAGVQGTSSAEMLGIPLNQMARVAALSGEMTDSDKEYLDSILPFERYPETYRPCCTDLLKWDAEYNSSALRDGIVTHWLSMLVRNPVVYFEAWELQTFGFWTVNQPDVYAFNNISGGAPKNGTSRMGDYGIEDSAGISNQTVRELFPGDESSIPIGALFWLLLYLGVSVCLMGKRQWLIILIPSVVLLGTLLVASPIWYWPRYAASIQFLLPIYLVMFAALHASSDFSAVAIHE